MRIRFVAASLAVLVGCGEKSTPSTITTELSVPSGESGDITITLHRTNGSGPVSVTYSTKDDSATAETDYVAASGKVEWADDDMEDKTITIPIVDDVTIEEVESMSIELGDPSNNGKIDKNAFTADIIDDDHPGNSFAVTSSGRLMHFDKEEPGRFSWAVDLSGLGSENVVALDIRPADNQLYALTNAAKLYTIDPMTGAATAKATLIADPTDTTNAFTGLSGSEFGIDFNPVVDRLRITSNTGQNLRVNVDTGEVTTDPAINGMSSGYTAIAHNNNVKPACRTTMYAIDPTSNRFLTQGFNDGAAQGVGGVGFDVTATGGFDVATDAAGVSTGLAILTNGGQSGMYTIDLSSGEATAARAVVGPLNPGETIKSFTVSTLDKDSPATQQPGELYGVTATDVISFNRANPEKLCTTKPLNGLAANETIYDLDMRPSNGVLYVLTGIGNQGKLHRVDPMSGNLSPAIPIGTLSGQSFGLDFEPYGAVPARVVSNTGQNLRVNDLTTGASTAATALSGAATSAAYTDSVQGAGTATMYVIDPGTDHLSLVSAPNNGALTDVGALGVDVTSVAGFDIDGRDNVAFVAINVGSSTELRTINLATGALSASLGTVAGGQLRGMTRTTPTTNVFGITTDDKLVRININDPSMVTVVSDPMLMPPTDKITGLTPGEHLMSIDVRPGANVMYALGSQGSIYTLNGSTAGANKAGALAPDPMDTSSPFSALSGTSFDIDFEPTGRVPLRIVSDAQQNLRIANLTNNTKCFTDSALSAAGPVKVTAAAYTNSFSGVSSTTLYVIDAMSGQLMTQSPPNSGTLTAVGALGGGSYYDASVPTLSGFDIAGGNNGVVLAAFQRPTSTPGQVEAFSRLYRINLATGEATQIGNGIGGAPIRSIAVQIR
jgi:hypothetical protein